MIYFMNLLGLSESDIESLIFSMISIILYTNHSSSSNSAYCHLLNNNDNIHFCRPSTEFIEPDAASSPVQKLTESDRI